MRGTGIPLTNKHNEYESVSASLYLLTQAKQSEASERNIPAHNRYAM